MARQQGWRILMRIEDLDRSRVRPGAAAEALDVLQWLGIDFDDGPIYQSDDLDPYRAAIRTLTDRKLAYSCRLTRKEVENAASAPHGDQGETAFPPQLRSTNPNDYCFAREDSNYRYVVKDECIDVVDCFAGRSQFNPAREIGDFIVWTKLGVPAYQLAVVVDDARQSVTDVVRGDDLLPSAARQILLYRALDLPIPNWWHLPLVIGDDGRRLAKRHGDTHLATYRTAGVPPQRIIGLLAKWCGICTQLREMSACDFLQRFDLDIVPRSPIVFSKEDHKWLSHAAQ